MKRIILCLSMVCAILASCDKRQESVRKVPIILVHNLYHFDESFISLEKALMTEFPDTNRFKIDYISLTEFLYNWDEDEDYSDELLAKYDKAIRIKARKPEIVILYGDQVAHAAAKIKSHPWVDGASFIFAGVIDPDHEGLLAGRKDFTGYWYKPGIKNTLDMMQDLGYSKWVTTDLDEDYLDDKIRTVMVEQLGDDPQHYKLNFDLSRPEFTATTTAPDSGATVLIPLHLKNTSLNGRFNNVEWLRSRNHMTTFLRLKDDRPSMDALRHPLGDYFGLTPERFDLNYHGSLNACIGGYFPHFNQIAHDIKKMVVDIVDNGAKPQDIPWQEHKSDYWLDWKFAQKNHQYANELPPYIKVVNLPWSKKSKLNNLIQDYGVVAALSLSWLILLIFIIMLAIRNNRKKARLYKDGVIAQENITKMSDTIASTGCYMFRIDRNGMVIFNHDFYLDTDIKNRPLHYTYFSKILSPTSWGTFSHAYNQSKPGRNIYRIKFSIISQNTGKEHTLSMRMCNNVQPDGTKTVSGMLFLIDDLQKMAEEREEALRREEQAAIKRAFLTSMGHEIRTPLNAIVGYSRLIFDMYDDLSPEEMALYSDVITKNTEQLLGLLNKVVSYSEEDGKEPDIVLSTKKVSDLMDEMYMTYRIIVPQHLEFHFQKGPENDYVLVNRGSMLQIVSNLMNNAVKFTEKGTITLGWKEEGDKISIYVKDTGCGIAPEKIDSIFEKYVKVSSHTEGAGIGLSLCNRLVKKMNGTIKVTSELGVGSCFEVILNKASL